ncbi:MAG: GNAT family protein [bacterium]|nr:GNAT family protein [bacterium]
MELKNGMSLTIQEAVKSDAQQIIEYLNTIGGESDNLLFGANEFDLSVELEENFIERAKQSPNSVVFVGRINDEIVCLGNAREYERKRISHIQELGVSVKKKYWGIGVGTCLMQALIQSAKETKTIKILHLGVKADNTAAIYLYKKMGFEEMGRFKKFFKIGTEYYDEILMNLYL